MKTFGDLLDYVGTDADKIAAYYIELNDIGMRIERTPYGRRLPLNKLMVTIGHDVPIFQSWYRVNTNTSGFVGVLQALRDTEGAKGYFRRRSPDPYDIVESYRTLAHYYRSGKFPDGYPHDIYFYDEIDAITFAMKIRGN